MDARSYRRPPPSVDAPPPLAAGRSGFSATSSMPMPLPMATNPNVNANAYFASPASTYRRDYRDYADSVVGGSQYGYGDRGVYADGRSATTTVYSDGGHGVGRDTWRDDDDEEEEPSWYRRSGDGAQAGGRTATTQRRRGRPPVEPWRYPEYMYDDDNEFDFSGRRPSRRRWRGRGSSRSRGRPLSELFDEVVHGVQNRLKGRSARPRRPEPYTPTAANVVNDPASAAAQQPDGVNGVGPQIVQPTPRRASIDGSILRQQLTGGGTGSTPSVRNGASRTPSASGSSLRRRAQQQQQADMRPDPVPIQPVLSEERDQLPLDKLPPPSPSPSSLGPLASFTSLLRTLSDLPLITPNSFSSRGERAPITHTYTPDTSSSRALHNLSLARRRGVIRYGKRGEEEGEYTKGDSWYVRSAMQEMQEARREMRRSIRRQEKERKRGEKNEVGGGEANHHRSNTMTTMAYSYSNGLSGHERRPTGSSHRTLVGVASPPPSYQGHAPNGVTMMPSPYGAVPVTYAAAPYYGAYGYPVYATAAPPASVPPPSAPGPHPPPPPLERQQQATRRLSGSSGRSRGSHHSSHHSSPRSRRRSPSRSHQSHRSGRSRRSDEGSIVAIPAEELPEGVRAAVSVEALGGMGAP